MSTTKSNSNWKLGLFVALGAIIFIFFIFFIGKNKNVFSSTINLYSYFDNVSGLSIGNNVRLAGIKVGTVTDIQILNDTTVRVDVMVESDVKKFIKKDAKLSIGSDGLMGDKVINVVQGTHDQPMIVDGDKLGSSKPFDTDKLMASLQKTVYNAEIVSTEFATISRKVNSRNGIIGRLIDDSTFSKSIAKTMTNLESASGGLSQNMEAAKSNFLLKGYFKKKEKAALDKKEQAIEEQEDKEKKERREERREKRAVKQNTAQ